MKSYNRYSSETALKPNLASNIPRITSCEWLKTESLARLLNPEDINN